MNYIIGVDIGTTRIKAISFDMNGNILEKENIAYPVYNRYPSWSEQKPEEIFNAVIEAIRKVFLKSNKRNDTLAGVAFSSAMHSLIAVDENGDTLTDCIIWADTRSKDYADKIKSSGIGHNIYLKTGTPIHPMSPLCKLCWLKDNMQDIFFKADKFISIKEYVFYKLFNKYIIDHSIASATGMFDIYDYRWNKDALELIGITEERLSVPVSTTFTIEGMSKYYADYMGIPIKTPFIIGASDGCLANIGVNAIQKGDAAVTIGTSGAIRVVSGEPKSDNSERIFSYILSENHYVSGGPVNNGGIIFSWFKDNFSNLELIEAEKLNRDVFELLNEKAGKIPAGSEGLIFLPYLLGERAPHWDANSRGVFFGINIKHTREHFLRALLEGVMFGIYSVGKALEETTGKIEIIYATGGFVNSELWVQMLADIFDKKVVIAESYEGSCLGAAILGMKALGIINDIEEGAKLVPLSKIYEPKRENHEVYMKNYQIFERLYFKLKDEFEIISSIQGNN